MNDALYEAARGFRKRAPKVDSWSLRLVDEWEETLCVRQGVVQPADCRLSRGAMVSVTEGNGVGYAATSDLSSQGLTRAAGRARDWARATAAHHLLSALQLPPRARSGHYETPVAQPWSSWSLADKVDFVQTACAALKIHQCITDWISWLGYRRTDSVLLDSTGVRIEQRFHFINPGLSVAANRGSQTQQRTGGGARGARQGGLEQLAALGLPDEAPQLARQALALLDARECPDGKRDLVLLPSQMALQIHESIGHPLELDRILGDERNYAGTSFVTVDMFGNYRYGSGLLNVTFDPGRPEELASYGFDDEGTPAERVFIIRNGILERPLGGATSQVRAGLTGTANCRASDWFRPPVDRMANLNLEPGDSTLDELIGSIEHGIVMDTNRSWSIDDSRNKFQFGCELGHLIVNGEVRELVRNPGYRGVSAGFWHSLAGVGDDSTFRVEGVNSCGKGEPNQLIGVGHASPACLFRSVEVFGGDQR